MKNFIMLLSAVAFVISTIACDGQGIKPPIESAGTAEEEIKGEISVSYYDRISYESYLEEAVKAFEEKHPDAKVNLMPFSVMPDIKSSVSENGSISVLDKDSSVVNDYISRINIELMSGKGADILAMDVLPCYKYAEAGQIEDLSFWIEADKAFDKNAYYYNIVESMKYKGGQYIFPLDFSFEYISVIKSMFDEKGVSLLHENGKFTYEDLVQIGEEPFARANVSAKVPVRMFDWYKPHGDYDVFIEMFERNYHRYVDIENKKANFTDGQFVALLETVRDYMTKGLFISKTEAFDDTERCLYRIKNVFVLYSDDKDKEFPVMIKNNAGKIIFECGQGYAVNSSSLNKRTAWEFIKFMASEEMQQSSLYSLNRPVNINANHEKARVESTASSMRWGENGLEVTFSEDETVIESYKSYLLALSQYSAMLNAYVIQDSIISQMVSKEAGKYFEGAKTASEAAETLESSVELYLNE